MTLDEVEVDVAGPAIYPATPAPLREGEHQRTSKCSAALANAPATPSSSAITDANDTECELETRKAESIAGSRNLSGRLTRSHYNLGPCSLHYRRH